MCTTNGRARTYMYDRLYCAITRGRGLLLPASLVNTAQLAAFIISTSPYAIPTPRLTPWRPLSPTALNKGSVQRLPAPL